MLGAEQVKNRPSQFWKDTRAALPFSEREACLAAAGWGRMGPVLELKHAPVRAYSSFTARIAVCSPNLTPHHPA